MRKKLKYSCKFCHNILFRYNPETNSYYGEGYDKQPLYYTEEYGKQLQKGYVEIECSECKKINKFPARFDLNDWKYLHGSLKIDTKSGEPV